MPLGIEPHVIKAHKTVLVSHEQHVVDPVLAREAERAVAAAGGRAGPLLGGHETADEGAELVDIGAGNAAGEGGGEEAVQLLGQGAVVVLVEAVGVLADARDVKA